MPSCRRSDRLWLNGHGEGAATLANMQKMDHFISPPDHLHLLSFLLIPPRLAACHHYFASAFWMMRPDLLGRWASRVVQPMQVLLSWLPSTISFCPLGWAEGGGERHLQMGWGVWVLEQSSAKPITLFTHFHTATGLVVNKLEEGVAKTKSW